MTSNDLRGDYDRLHEVVSESLNAADPRGFLEMGAPGDQYEPEVGTILPRLKDAASAYVVAVIIDEESLWLVLKDGRRLEVNRSSDLEFIRGVSTRVRALLT